MPSSPHWSFGPFRLDSVGACLWRGDGLLTLRPKAVAILAYLVSHADQVVLKEALLEAVWPHDVVSEGVLKTCIGQIRQALGETARSPQYITTLHRRGYRFIAPVTSVEQPLVALGEEFLPYGQPRSSPPTSKVSASPLELVVSRDAELAELHQRFAQALQGTRQVVFITGEAGIGKTALVDSFVARMVPTTSLWITRGQCIEQYGAGEAYLPLLEALGRLGRAPGGARLVDLLRHYAQSWLLQLSALVPDEEYEAIQQRGRGVTRERMLRELAEVVEALTTNQLLVLVLEDVHWSDTSTIEWLAYIARRREAAQLLVLVTYRPVEAIVHAHPVHTVTQDLQVHGQAVELVLGYLSTAGVTTYLARRFGARALPEELAEVLHQRTNGNPLFLVTLLDDMVRQGVLQEGTTGWELPGGLELAVSRVPESLRHLIEQQLSYLSPVDQQIVAAASVAGAEFSAAAVAAGVDQAVEDVEISCSTLARQGQFLRACGTATWPDGTVASSYGFLHALYQEIVYDRVPVGQRVRVHLQIGTRLELAYDAQSREIAAELAMHFVQGRDAPRAVQYLHAAGENALQRSAYQKAVAYLTEGLALLSTSPDTLERAQHELTLQLTLGNALIPTKGYTQEVETVYGRTWELCQKIGETSHLFPALRGLLATSGQRGKLHTALELCETFFGLAQRQNKPDLLLEAHRMLASIWLHLGAFAHAREQVECGLTLYDVHRHHAHAFLYAQDPGISCLIYAALTLWYLGYSDQAMQRCYEALALAEGLDHSHSAAWVNSFAATVHQLRDEIPQAQERAELSMEICREQGFTFRWARGAILRGSSLVARGQGQEGLAHIRQGLAAHRATGIELGLTYYLTLLAKGCEQVGQVDEGLTVLTEALEIVRKTGERWWEAEIYRVQGQLLFARSKDKYVGAETSFHRAIEVAREQQARAWELRAATSLARLWQRQGKRREACELLTPVYEWFTEGFNTSDLKDAMTLLEELRV